MEMYALVSCRGKETETMLTVLLKSQVKRCVPLCLLAIKSIDVAL